MKLGTIKKEARNCLKINFGKAILLLIISLFSILCGIIVSQTLTLYLDQKFIDYNFNINTSINSLIITGTGLIFSFLLLTPLQLNIKKWYMNMKLNKSQLSDAFDIFGSIKNYFSAVWYGIIKTIAFALIYFLLALPAVIISIILKIQMNSISNSNGVLLMVLVTVLIIFIIISMLYAVYFALSFFYADYIYLSKITTNPIKAIILSMKMSNNQKGGLALMYISLLPLVVLCILILPILFVVPYIKSTLAFYAKEKLKSIKNYDNADLIQN